jgi:hypothetical protein
MKKNAYYTVLYGEPAAINRKLGAWVSVVLSWPKSVLDVFLRRNMGERYFTLFKSILIFLALWFIPIGMKNLYFSEMISSTSYYFFLILYAIMSGVRYMEIRRKPSVFDFAKFSLSRGIPYDIFLRIKLFGKPLSQRTIEVYVEPLLCFIIGVILIVLQQGPVGALIILCSISYFVCNSISAIHGDHFIMDKIDEILLSRDLNTIFLNDEELSPKQVPFFTRKPTTRELRQNFLDHLNNDDDHDDAVPIN